MGWDFKPMASIIVQEKPPSSCELCKEYAGEMIWYSICIICLRDKSKIISSENRKPGKAVLPRYLRNRIPGIADVYPPINSQEDSDQDIPDDNRDTENNSSHDLYHLHLFLWFRAWNIRLALIESEEDISFGIRDEWAKRVEFALNFIDMNEETLKLSSINSAMNACKDEPYWTLLENAPEEVYERYRLENKGESCLKYLDQNGDTRLFFFSYPTPKDIESVLGKNPIEFYSDNEQVSSSSNLYLMLQDYLRERGIIVNLPTEFLRPRWINYVTFQSGPPISLQRLMQWDWPFVRQRFGGRVEYYGWYIGGSGPSRGYRDFSFCREYDGYNRPTYYKFRYHVDGTLSTIPGEEIDMEEWKSMIENFVIPKILRDLRNHFDYYLWPRETES